MPCLLALWAGALSAWAEPLAVDEMAIAAWDAVPRQTLHGELRVGVVAFHAGGMDRVEFRIGEGPPVAVREMRDNPDTGVREYWTPLRAADYPAGPLIVHVTAIPVAGVPRELPPLPLFVQREPERTAYVDPRGSDATGNGSPDRPWATLYRAGKWLEKDGSADGATIYLKAGDYVWTRPLHSDGVRTRDGFLTIAAAPGVERGQVRIKSDGLGRGGMGTKNLRMRNVTLSNVCLDNDWAERGAIWLNGVEAVGEARRSPEQWTAGWQARYATDSIFRLGVDGPSGSTLVRGCRAEEIASDVFSDSNTVINCVARDVAAPAGTGYHPDVVQYYGLDENLIIYGLEATDKINSQGIFPWPHSESVTNLAIVNCRVRSMGDWLAFQTGARARHLLIQDSLIGRALWRGDKGFTARNVVVKNSRFIAGPGYAKGVIYRD